MERHSAQRRLTDPWDDPYDADRDWGSHEAANARQAARGPFPEQLSARLGPIIGSVGPRPCSLCEPGYVCHFHRED